MFEDSAKRDEIEMARRIDCVLHRSEREPFFTECAAGHCSSAVLGRRLKSVRVEARGREGPHRLAEPRSNVQRAHALAKIQQTLGRRYLMSEIIRLIFELLLRPIIFWRAVVSVGPIGNRLRIGEDK